MARQIQIRRGTTDEHSDFTGAVGEITMDTTNNTLRVHDGETVGGTMLAKQSELDAADFVVETWRSTDGKEWYRKYKSGWIVQGGRYTLIGPWTGGSAPVAYITLQVRMADANYAITIARSSTVGNILTPVCDHVTVSGFQIANYCSSSSTSTSGWWQIEGMAE